MGTHELPPKSGKLYKRCLLTTYIETHYIAHRAIDPIKPTLTSEIYNSLLSVSTRSGINFRDDLKRFKPRCQAKEGNRKNKFFREA